jgi:YHS domain-containing protein
MRKLGCKAGVAFLMALFMLVAGRVSIGMAQDVQGPVQVDNVICPVSGQEIVQDQRGINAAEYNGKVYNLCSLACKEAFLADPEKFSILADETAAVVPDEPVPADVILGPKGEGAQ